MGVRGRLSASLAAALFFTVYLPARPAFPEQSAVIIKEVGAAQPEKSAQPVNTDVVIPGSGSVPDESVMIKESSMEESYKNALGENDRLKAETRRLNDMLSREQSKGTIYGTRLQNYMAQMEAMKNEYDRLFAQRNREKAAYDEELARMKLEQERIQKESADYRKSVETSPPAKRVRELELLNKEMADQMHNAMPEQEKLKKENGKLHFNLGNSYYRNADYRNAEHEYERALQNLPSDPDTLFNLAVICDYYVRNPGKAVVYYNRYLKLRPKSKQALLIKKRIAMDEIDVKMENK